MITEDNSIGATESTLRCLVTTSPGYGVRVTIFGAGFIGRSLIPDFLTANCRVRVLDRNTCPAEFVSKVEWITGEFRNQPDIRRALDGTDIAVHLVSSTVPGDDGINPAKELVDNIFSTLQFLDLCKECDVRRVVFASSASVYGLQTVAPIPETVITDPISPHGIHKLVIEKYLLLYRFHQGLDIRIVRISNPYGPGQKIYGRQGFIALSIGHIRNGQPIMLRDGGRPVRDFIFIEDLSRAIVRTSLAVETPVLLNIGSGTGHSILEVLSIIEEIVGRKLPTIRAESRKVDIPNSVLDITMAQKYLGFELMHSLRTGLLKTLRHHGIPVTGDGDKS